MKKKSVAKRPKASKKAAELEQHTQEMAENLIRVVSTMPEEHWRTLISYVEVLRLNERAKKFMKPTVLSFSGLQKNAKYDA